MGFAKKPSTGQNVQGVDKKSTAHHSLPPGESAISALRFAKEAAISAYKIADPKGYRRNKAAKFIDKHL